MTSHISFARQLRLRRLYRHHDQRLVIVPLDHSVSDGPITDRLDTLVGQLVAGGVDGVILHKGSVRHVSPERFAHTALIVHLSASTARAPDPNAKYLVTSVEEALRLGADGVSVHVNLGSREEARQIADLGAVAEACDRWNLPLLAMIYPRGASIPDPRAPEVVAHAASLAADLGADIVKTVYPGSIAAMAEITNACPIPLLIAGGPRRDHADAVLTDIRDALRGGAAGVAMGRNVFQAEDPTAAARAVVDLVHATPQPTRPEVRELSLNAS